MEIPAASHPIWSILQVSLLVVALGLVLYFNYNTFDPVKDPRAMLIVAILAGGWEFGKRLLARSNNVQ
jgi:hypothetical protein